MENNQKIIIALLCVIVIILIVGIAIFTPLLKEESNLAISKKKINKGDSLVLKLTDSHGNPIKNAKIHIKLKDEEGITIDENIKTNSKGKAKLKMEEKGKYLVKCDYNGDMHFASSSTAGKLIVKKAANQGSDDKKNSNQNSNSGLSEDGYTYYPEYGPAVDAFGTTREYAIAHNYHYLPRTVDGQDMGAYIPYDPTNGCYHM